MFFTECECLAERHPDLAAAVQQVDAQLVEMRTDGIIRAADLASFLRIDPNQVDAVLEKLSHEKLLRREEMVECTHCRMAAPRSEYQQQLEDEGEYRCTSCDRPLTDTSAKTITAYRRGEKWKEVPPLPEEASERLRLQAESLDENALYTHARLAELFGLPEEALRKRLERYRQTSLDHGWEEIANCRVNEPKYRYELRAVKHVIEDMLASS
jgi:hypothetical protein